MLNQCFISLAPIEIDTGFLVQVLAATGKNEKNAYYYVSNIDDLDKLYSCPVTRRKGDYNYVKLSDLNGEQLSLLCADKNKLEDDCSNLDIISNNFSWKSKRFLTGFELGTNLDLHPAIYGILAGYMGVQLTLFVAYFDGTRASLGNAEDTAQLIGGLTYLLGRVATNAAIAATSEYVSLRVTNNSFGLFSTPIGMYADASSRLAERIIDYYTIRSRRNHN